MIVRAIVPLSGTSELHAATYQQFLMNMSSPRESAHYARPGFTRSSAGEQALLPE